MDQELIKSIDQFVSKNTTIRKLSVEEANILAHRLSTKFVANPQAVWWWSSLSCDCRTLDYGDKNGYEVIGELVPSDQIVNLLVTDDELPPWPAYSGPLAAILELIGEQRFFEYILFEQDQSWAVFDTHHNDLIFVGHILNEI